MMNTRRGTSRPVVLSMLCMLASCSSPTEGPDTTAPASVVVDPGSALLASLGDTVELSATVRNGASQAVSAGVTWTSSAPDVATVDAAGRVIAVANGQTSVRATTGSVSGEALITVQQAVQAAESSGSDQGADVGQPLDSTLVLTLKDARGHPIAGAPVTFAVTTGGGSVDPASAQTGADGSVSATWTLGVVAGLQELQATAGFSGEAVEAYSAIGFPLDATALAVFAGDAQTEITGAVLPSALQVQARDTHGNGVPDVAVQFSVSGDAALDATEVYTDLDGVASVGLTLGSVLGTYSVTASVPDSLTATGQGLQGSPLTLVADAVPYQVAAVSGLVVGDTVTLTGSGFDPALTGNSVLVGGSAAEIVRGTQSELDIVVPSFGCTPERGQSLEVSRSGQQVVQAVTVTPANALSLAVGEQLVLSDASDFCLQFLPGADEEYLVGLTSTAWFDGGASFSLAAADSVGPFPAPWRASTASGSPLRASVASRDVTHFRDAETKLREAERQLVDRITGSASSLEAAAGLSGPAPAPPSVGDVLNVRLPDLTGDACVDHVPVSAEVFSVGARLVLATTETLPTNPALLLVLQQAADALHSAFGNQGIDRIVSYLGIPGQWDADSRVTVVLTPAVSAMGLPVYASAVDQLPRTLCTSSDEGYFVYVAIPAGATIADLGTVMAQAPSDLAHQAAHIVQWARRFAQAGNLLPSWMAEGQAELVVEFVGLELAGLPRQQELGAAVLTMPGVSTWIADRFDRLAAFQGWDGAAGRVTGAPEGCSLFGFGGVAPVCLPEAGPGAAWSFLRYLSDRFGAQATGGEPALQQAIVDLQSGSDPVAQIEALLGATLPELMVDWAGMLYVDGRLAPSVAPRLQMTTWKLDELIPAGPKRIAPDTFGFGDFTRGGTVVGGGTAYTLLTSSGNHGSLSVRADDGVGGAIADVLRPRLWVVRMR